MKLNDVGKKIWHDAKKELPKESGKYICVYSEFLGVTGMNYSNKYKLFNCYDDSDKRYAKKYHIPVSYWATFEELGIER